jgi:hypothetical protein
MLWEKQAKRLERCWILIAIASRFWLAMAMGIWRANVSRWASEIRDPVPETMLKI